MYINLETAETNSLSLSGLTPTLWGFATAEEVFLIQKEMARTSSRVQRWRHSHRPSTNTKIWIFLGNPTLARTVNFATSANPAGWELWLFSPPPEHSIPLRGGCICNTPNRKLAFKIQSQFCCLLSLAMVLNMVVQSPLPSNILSILAKNISSFLSSYLNMSSQHFLAHAELYFTS